ncbi:MAG TPA: peptidylprolyl isomerase [Polyangiaceae bacterium]|nr:peptidylprolyl isomerase [Polyangiaceae bacterium]
MRNLLRKAAVRASFLALCTAGIGCQAPAPPAAVAAAETTPTETQPAHEAPPPAQPAAPPAPAPAPAAVPPPAAPAPEAEPAATNQALLEPERATETAPERFTAVLHTTKGELHIDVRRSWAPNGADRFYNLVKLGFFDGVAFFRVVAGFMAQTGLHGDPAVNSAWRSRMIADDPVAQSNVPGTMSFAAAGPNTRTTQVFINLVANDRLDAMGFAPFGRVRELDLAQQLFAGYGEGAPAGSGPMQQRIQREGNRYLKAEFPKLDYIERATIENEMRAPLKQRELPVRAAP